MKGDRKQMHEGFRHRRITKLKKEVCRAWRSEQDARFQIKTFLIVVNFNTRIKLF